MLPLTLHSPTLAASSWYLYHLYAAAYSNGLIPDSSLVCGTIFFILRKSSHILISEKTLQITERRCPDGTCSSIRTGSSSRGLGKVKMYFFDETNQHFYKADHLRRVASGQPNFQSSPARNSQLFPCSKLLAPAFLLTLPSFLISSLIGMPPPASSWRH